MLIVYGLFEAGRFVYTNNALSQAAREGARLAAVEARWIGDGGLSCVASPNLITAANPGAHVCPPDANSLRADVVSAVNRMFVIGAVSDVFLACTAKGDPTPSGPWTEVTVAFPRCGGAAPNRTGDVVSVRVAFTSQPILPLFGPIDMTASTSMVIN
jgi:hypothetical protein